MRSAGSRAGAASTTGATTRALSAPDPGIRRARHHAGGGAVGKIPRAVGRQRRSGVQGVCAIRDHRREIANWDRDVLAAELGLACLLALVAATPAVAQVGFDRWGGDYPSFTMRSGDPAQCAAGCERDSRCRAWAFSYPATESPNAQCWLKSRVTARVAGVVLRLGRARRRRDRAARRADRIRHRSHGRRLPAFRIAGRTIPARPASSHARRRRAAAPGPICGPAISAPSASCYLKDRITRPVRRPCCISGVVR